MHLNLDGKEGCERWVLRIRPGDLTGMRVAKGDGITMQP